MSASNLIIEHRNCGDVKKCPKNLFYEYRLIDNYNA